MKEIKTISSQAPKLKNLDYEFLFKEMIRYVQEVSGTIWTDYNVHDPGVTIIEYLCYALTDLAYRTNLDVKDLIYTQKTNNSNTFFPPETIFPAAPLTTIDYRKLLLDEISELQNCWIYKSQSSNYEGLFDVYLQIDEWIDEQKHHNVEENIKRKARKVLMEHRNLGEDVAEIISLKRKKIDVSTRLEISPIVDEEEIMVAILLTIESAFNQSIHHYPYQSIINEGKPLSQVFEGPLMTQGYIPTEALKDKIVIIDGEEIRINLLNIEGVKSVSTVKLSVNKSTIVNADRIKLKADEFPFLNKEFLNNGDAKNKIILNKLGKDIQIDFMEVKYLYNLKWNQGYRGKVEDHSYQFKQPISSFNQKDIAAYNSIQRFFPHIYGIGAAGLPVYATIEQRIQAQQLKGYLALFEQFFSTYLADLSQLSNWYSTNLTEQRAATSLVDYFTNLLPSDLPDFNSLLADGLSEEDANKVMKQLFAKTADLLERKNQILDHLLARFSESLDDLFYRHYRERGSYDTNTLDKLIKAKVNFLKEYPTLSKDRGIGFNYESAIWNSRENVSGFKKLLCRKFGFLDYQNKRLTTPLINGKKIRPKKENYRQQSATKIPLKELLIFGGNPMNYIEAIKEGETTQIQFIYTDNTVNIGESASPEIKITELCSEIREMNELSAGFYMVEHILLRSDNFKKEYHQPLYRWLLLIALDELNLTLISQPSVHTTTLEELSEYFLTVSISSESCKLIEYNPDESSEQPFAGIVNVDKKYRIGIYGKGGQELLLKSKELYRFREAKTMQADLRKFLANRENQVHKNIRFSIEQQRIIEQHDMSVFIDRQISFVFPDWLSALNDPDHKNHFLNTIRCYLPTHLKPNFYWLSFEEMQPFETLFEEWEKSLATEFEGEYDKKKTTNKLRDYLLKKYTNKQLKLSI